MIVSSDPAMLTEWAVGFLTLFDERPRPRVAIHCGGAVYRDGDYFGGDVNLDPPGGRPGNGRRGVDHPQPVADAVGAVRAIWTSRRSGRSR